MPTFNLSCGMQKKSMENATEKCHDNDAYKPDAAINHLKVGKQTRLQCDGGSTADGLGRERITFAFWTLKGEISYVMSLFPAWEEATFHLSSIRHDSIKMAGCHTRYTKKETPNLSQAGWSIVTICFCPLQWAS